MDIVIIYSSIDKLFINNFMDNLQSKITSEIVQYKRFNFILVDEKEGVPDFDYLFCIITENFKPSNLIYKALKDSNLLPLFFCPKELISYKLLSKITGIDFTNFEFGMKILVLYLKELLILFLEHGHDNLRIIEKAKGIIYNLNIDFQDIKLKLKSTIGQIKPIPVDKNKDKKYLKDQYHKIKTIIKNSEIYGSDLIVFPELSCPINFLGKFDNLIKNYENDIICIFAYNRIDYSYFYKKIPKPGWEFYPNLNTDNKKRKVNFIRICIKNKNKFTYYNQLKITPFIEELEEEETISLLTGDHLYLLKTNWGNIIPLICKDFLTTDRENPFKQPFKNLVGEIAYEHLYKFEDSLDFLFIATCNEKQEHFILNSISLYNDEIYTRNCSIFSINCSIFGSSLVLIPQKIHPSAKYPEEYEITKQNFCRDKICTIFKLPEKVEYIPIINIIKTKSYIDDSKSRIMKQVEHERLLTIEKK